ncbi:MAG: hypothetical protein ACM362_00215 [Candidatus Methylomirabilota bacterium]
MAAKQLLDEEEARGGIRDPKGWSVVLDKQRSAPAFREGGLAVRRRPTGPPRHWPSPSSGVGGRP